MSTYSEQQGGPGAVLWAVIITIVIIGLLVLFNSCEPLDDPVEGGKKSEEGIGDVNFTVTFPDFSDTIIVVIY